MQITNDLQEMGKLDLTEHTLVDVTRLYVLTPKAQKINVSHGTKGLDMTWTCCRSIGLNISSDLLIIAIPVPMTKSLKLPTKQKIGLGLLFSMGSFVIIATILTKYYNLPDVFSTIYMFWYTREASVAIWVANLPGIWPLAREHIRFLREHTGSYVTDSNRRTHAYGSSCGNMSKVTRSHTQTGTFQNVPSGTDIEMIAAFAKLDMQLIHLSEKPGSSDDQKNGFEIAASAASSRLSRVSVDSDKRALNQSSSWKGLGVLEVQMNTKVEIQRDDWDGKKMEASAIKTSVEGSEGEVGKTRRPECRPLCTH